MNVEDALIARKSVRAFLPKSVSRDAIERILKAAGHAPSGSNTQPWRVAVVTGKKKIQLENKLIAAFQREEDVNMDYVYYPVEWVEPYRSRRKACGLQMYSVAKISKNNREKQRAQWQVNYTAFGAPVALYFFMDSIMQKGSYIDYGMFLQSIMLAAVEEGLGTCAQAALAQFPHIIKPELGYPSDSVLMCGMALGYEDTQAPPNSYRTPRVEVDVFTRFFEDK